MLASFLWSFLMDFSILCGTLVMSMLVTRLKSSKFMKGDLDMNRLSPTVSNPKVETSRRGRKVVKMLAKAMSVVSKLFTENSCNYLTLSELLYLEATLASDIETLKNQISKRKEEMTQYESSNSVR